MDKNGIVSKFEGEFRKNKEEERQRKQYEREKKLWEGYHPKEVGWGASFDNQNDSYKNTPGYQYAIWYYYKRLQLLKISLVPFFLAIVAGIFFLRRPSFRMYLITGGLIGLSRAIGTNGLDNEGQLSFSRLLSSYQFFKLGESERIRKRIKAFFSSLPFPPIMILWHIYDFFEVMINQDFPIPQKRESDFSSPREEIVGRIDDDGYVYKRHM